MKSNIPYMMMSIYAGNHIYGTPLNPYSLIRSVGGSSGGEGGLISTRCSPIGIATDIGGSTRIPSLFCGVYGFKPTSERAGQDGVLMPIKSRIYPMVAGTMALGPMANNFKDLLYSC